MRAGNYWESEWAPGLALTIPAVGSQGGRRFATPRRHPDELTQKFLLLASSFRISTASFSKLPDSRSTTSLIRSLVRTLTLRE